MLVHAVRAHGRWSAELGSDARWRLVRRGHFPRYASELDWTPREVGALLDRCPPPGAGRPGRPD